TELSNSNNKNLMVIKQQIKETSSFVNLVYEQIKPQSHQKDKGGLVGVIGNHDIGTLKAKSMLDIAYNMAKFNNCTDYEKTYKDFKQLIKGIKSTNELAKLLFEQFQLNDYQKEHLYV